MLLLCCCLVYQRRKARTAQHDADAAQSKLAKGVNVNADGPNLEAGRVDSEGHRAKMEKLDQMRFAKSFAKPRGQSPIAAFGTQKSTGAFGFGSPLGTPTGDDTPTGFMGKLFSAKSQVSISHLLTLVF